MDLNKEETFWFEDIKICITLLKADIHLDNKNDFTEDLKKLKEAINKYLEANETENNSKLLSTNKN